LAKYQDGEQHSQCYHCHDPRSNHGVIKIAISLKHQNLQ
jgi:hypothetical protein